MVDDTKQRLLVSAGEIFAEKGYEPASVREICQRAEANIAAVNYHFGEKRQLYVAAVRHAQCCQAADVPFPEWPPEIPAAERLREFIRTMFERMLAENRPRWHLELMLRELARPTEACAAVVDDYIRPMADTLRSILVDLLPAEMSEAERWLVGFSIVGQVLFYYVHQPIIRLLMRDATEPPPVTALAEHVTRFTLAALGEVPPLAGRPQNKVPE